MSSLGREIFQLGYEISPVILVDGVASLIPGGLLPIVALTEAANFTLGLLSGDVPNLDQFFAHWKPLPGTELLANQVAMYPFANAAIAANAQIAQPLPISMLMNCPVQQSGGYTAKLATVTTLIQTLTQHNASGGTYTIATPSQIFTNCLLLAVRDVSAGDSKQVQHTFQFDFLQPLITVNQALQVYNNLMNKIANGLVTPAIPTWSGALSAIGSSVSQTASSVYSSLTNLLPGVGSAINSASNLL